MRKKNVMRIKYKVRVEQLKKSTLAQINKSKGNARITKLQIGFPRSATWPIVYNHPHMAGSILVDEGNRKR